MNDSIIKLNNLDKLNELINLDENELIMEGGGSKLADITNLLPNSVTTIDGLNTRINIWINKPSELNPDYRINGKVSETNKPQLKALSFKMKQIIINDIKTKINRVHTILKSAQTFIPNINLFEKLIKSFYTLINNYGKFLSDLKTLPQYTLYLNTKNNHLQRVLKFMELNRDLLVKKLHEINGLINDINKISEMKRNSSSSSLVSLTNSKLSSKKAIYQKIVDTFEQLNEVYNYTINVDNVQTFVDNIKLLKDRPGSASSTTISRDVRRGRASNKIRRSSTGSIGNIQGRASSQNRNLFGRRRGSASNKIRRSSNGSIGNITNRLHKTSIHNPRREDGSIKPIEAWVLKNAESESKFNETRRNQETRTRQKTRINQKTRQSDQQSSRITNKQFEELSNLIKKQKVEKQAAEKQKVEKQAAEKQAAIKKANKLLELGTSDAALDQINAVIKNVNSGVNAVKEKTNEVEEEIKKGQLNKSNDALIEAQDLVEAVKESQKRLNEGIINAKTNINTYLTKIKEMQEKLNRLLTSSSEVERKILEAIQDKIKDVEDTIKKINKDVENANEAVETAKLAVEKAKLEQEAAQRKAAEEQKRQEKAEARRKVAEEARKAAQKEEARKAAQKEGKMSQEKLEKIRNEEDQAHQHLKTRLENIKKKANEELERRLKAKEEQKIQKKVAAEEQARLAQEAAAAEEEQERLAQEAARKAEEQKRQKAEEARQALEALKLKINNNTDRDLLKQIKELEKKIENKTEIEELEKKVQEIIKKIEERKAAEAIAISVAKVQETTKQALEKAQQAQEEALEAARQKQEEAQAQEKVAETIAISVAKAQELEEKPQELNFEVPAVIDQIIKLFPENWKQIQKSINKLNELIDQRGGAAFIDAADAQTSNKNNGTGKSNFMEHKDDIINITSILQQIYDLFELIQSQHAVGSKSLENTLLFALYFTTQKIYIDECEKIENKDLKQAFIKNIEKMYESFREEYIEAFNEYKNPEKYEVPKGYYHDRLKSKLTKPNNGNISIPELSKIIDNYHQDILSKFIAVAVNKAIEPEEDDLFRRIAVAVRKSTEAQNKDNEPEEDDLFRKIAIAVSKSTETEIQQKGTEEDDLFRKIAIAVSKSTEIAIAVSKSNGPEGVEESKNTPPPEEIELRKHVVVAALASKTQQTKNQQNVSSQHTPGDPPETEGENKNKIKYLVKYAKLAGLGIAGLVVSTGAVGLVSTGAVGLVSTGAVGLGTVGIAGGTPVLVLGIAGAAGAAIGIPGYGVYKLGQYSYENISEKITDIINKLKRSQGVTKEEHALLVKYQFDFINKSNDYFSDIYTEFVQNIKDIINQINNKQNSSFKREFQSINKFDKTDISIFEIVKLNVLYRISNIMIPSSKDTDSDSSPQMNSIIENLVEMMKQKVDKSIVETNSKMDDAAYYTNEIFAFQQIIIAALLHKYENITGFHEEFIQISNAYKDKQDNLKKKPSEILRAMKIMFVMYYLQNITIDTLFEF